MEFQRPPPDVLPHGLRVLKMLAMADGRFDASERALLETAQRLFGGDHDLDALTAISPDELARRVQGPALRRQLVRAMVIVSLVDGEVSTEEARMLEIYAGALGVDTPDLTLMRHLADRHLVRARFDLARRFFAREKMIELTREKGLGWLARSLAAMAGLREDAEIAGRYRALAGCPEGSLGRAYAEFVTSNGFSFPGEKGSPPEVITLHDLTHVLSGYGTDPHGELEVLAFHAGCQREEKDPFAFLMFGIAEFHLGIAVSPVATGARGMLDPPRVFAALQRGLACKIDPTDGWDPWPLMDRPLVELRAEVGIV
ncbi:MAG: hypothetical protein IT374_23260 [Polyangiaceae bacterium]|nr:hypothetical protein [Polyangiaceae bacterium]